MSLYTSAFAPVLAGTAALAAVWGNRSERWVAAICVAGVVATLAARTPWLHRYAKVETGVFVVDASMFAALLALAIVERRWWLRWVAALQLVATLGHVVKAIDPTFLAGGYAIMLQTSAYPIVLLVLVAALRRMAGQNVTATSQRY